MTWITAAANPPIVGTGDTITIDVTPASGSGAPTGTVKLWISDGTVGSTPTTTTVTLSNGSATYSFVAAQAGAHTIRAIYSGDSTFASSSATSVIGNQGFRLTSTSPTIVPPSAGSSTITITPQEGYTGSIAWVITSSPPFTNGCYSLSNATVSSATVPVTATLTVNTSTTACGGAAMIQGPGKSASAIVARSNTPHHRFPFGIAMGGLLFAGVLTFGSRKSRLVGSTALMLALTFVLPGCGGSSSPINKGGSSTVAAGTYTLTIVGTDTASPTISGSTSVSVTVQ